MADCLSLVLQCSRCPKAFINQTFLDAHMAKRHSDVNVEIESAAAAARPLSAAAESPLTQPAELESIRKRLQQTEQRLMHEAEARNEAELQVLPLHLSFNSYPVRGVFRGALVPQPALEVKKNCTNI